MCISEKPTSPGSCQEGAWHLPPQGKGSIVLTYVAFVVHLIVGEFHAVEADDLPHPGLSRAGRVRVDIESGSDARVVRIPSYHPL